MNIDQAPNIHQFVTWTRKDFVAAFRNDIKLGQTELGIGIPRSTIADWRGFYQDLWDSQQKILRLNAAQSLPLKPIKHRRVFDQK